jgi:hypothetical protein
MDTIKARVIRPTLLNVMRFLNPRRRPHCGAPQLRATPLGYKLLPPIVEAAATLRHFPKKQLSGISGQESVHPVQDRPIDLNVSDR